MKRRWLLLLLLPPVAVTLYPLLFTPWNDGISSLFLVFCLLPAALGFGWVPIAHLRAEKSFLQRTCRRRKRIFNLFRACGRETLAEGFVLLGA